MNLNTAKLTDIYEHGLDAYVSVEKRNTYFQS